MDFLLNHLNFNSFDSSIDVSYALYMSFFPLNFRCDILVDHFGYDIVLGKVHSRYE